MTNVGLVFFLHPYGVPHFMMKDTVSVLAKPGKWTQIEIEETEVNVFPMRRKMNVRPRLEYYV